MSLRHTNKHSHTDVYILHVRGKSAGNHLIFRLRLHLHRLRRVLAFPHFANSCVLRFSADLALFMISQNHLALPGILAFSLAFSANIQLALAAAAVMDIWSLFVASHY